MAAQHEAHTPLVSVLCNVAQTLRQEVVVAQVGWG